MSEPIPCPACGTTHTGGETTCRVCGYALTSATPNNAGTGRCARCGTEMPTQFDFCPICGMDQRRRLSRPATGALKVTVGPAGMVQARAQPPAPGSRPPSLTPTAPPTPGAAHANQGFAPTQPPAGFGPPGGGRAVPSVRAVQPGPASSGPVAVMQQAPPMGRAPAPSGSAPAAVASPSPAPSPAPAPAPAPAPSPVKPAGPTGWAGGGQVRLVCIERDGSEGRSFPISGAVVSIGRSMGEVRFDQDPFISPLHARLERGADGRFDLVDTQSRNGVYLRITRPEPVYPGDLFLVGHQLLRLENVDAAGEQPADSDGTRTFGTPLDPPWGRLSLLGRGSMTGDHYYLRPTQVVLGRESGDLLFPRDQFLSRQHAKLELQVDGASMSVFLEDLGSANGTYLRLRGRASIGPNDTFRVGDQILRIKAD